MPSKVLIIIISDFLAHFTRVFPHLIILSSPFFLSNCMMPFLELFSKPIYCQYRVVIYKVNE